MHTLIIKKIYSQAVNTYEIINRILTFGLDAHWRKKAAQAAAQRGGSVWLDVCSGTGDMAILLSGFAKSKVNLVASDISFPMVEKAVLKKGARQVNFLISDSAKLPFLDNTFDLVTVSFATRNLNVSRDFLIRYFREFKRVLKPGGAFINLETSQPPGIMARFLFHMYARIFILPVGFLISGSKLAYNYLSYTMLRFWNADELADILLTSGFSQVKFSRMAFGACAIHTAVK